METLQMFHQISPAVAAFGVLALPWTAVLAMNLLSVFASGAARGTAVGKWQAAA